MINWYVENMIQWNSRDCKTWPSVLLKHFLFATDRWKDWQYALKLFLVIWSSGSTLQRKTKTTVTVYVWLRPFSDKIQSTTMSRSPNTSLSGIPFSDSPKLHYPKKTENIYLILYKA